MTSAATGTDSSWLAELANSLEHAVWSWDADSGRVLVTNHAFRRQFAALSDPWAHGGELLLAHVHAQDRERVRRARDRLPAQGYEEDYLLVLPGGRVARVQEKAIPHTGASQVTHLLRDVSWQFDTSAQLRAEISRRTDAERDLSVSEAKYRLHKGDEVVLSSADARYGSALFDMVPLGGRAMPRRASLVSRVLSRIAGLLPGPGGMVAA